MRNRQRDELEYITSRLLMEFQQKFREWNEEYEGLERDLGIRGTFTDFWRKAKKIKAVVWDGADDRTWREGLRVILFEVIGNAFLMLYDLDYPTPQTQLRVSPPERSGLPCDCISADDSAAIHTTECSVWKPIPHDHTPGIICPNPGCEYTTSFNPAGPDRHA